MAKSPSSFGSRLLCWGGVWRPHCRPVVHISGVYKDAVGEVAFTVCPARDIAPPDLSLKSGVAILNARASQLGIVPVKGVVSEMYNMRLDVGNLRNQTFAKSPTNAVASALLMRLL